MNGPFLEALGLSLTLTLLHVLWIGVAIALADAAVAWCLRRATASSRYVTHVGGLLLLALSLPTTFVVVWPRQPASPTVAVVERAPALLRASPLAVAGRTPATLPAPATIVDIQPAPPPPASRPFLPVAAPYIAAAYLLGVFVMLARLGVGLWGGRQLRLSGRATTDPELLGTVARQARRIGLRLVPVVAWCDRIAVPIVVGIVKPTILLPAALATGFDLRQLELLLAHELAHVRRFDLWINLLQRLVEAVLFFHPAAWFLSRRVSAERELACDDLVLAGGTGRVQYAEALLGMAERSFALRGTALPGSAVFVAATGESPTQFKRRILRLLEAQGTPRPQLTGRGVLMALVAGVLLLGGLAMFSAEGGDGAKDAQESPAGEPPAKNADNKDPAAKAIVKEPAPPADKVPVPVTGQVLTVDSDTQLVTISLGVDDRIARGRRLSVYRGGKNAGDPRILVGEVEIVRFIDDVAEARILSAEDTVKAGDHVTSNRFPVSFSKAQKGIEIGIAIASERRTFREGERVPLEFVIRNVSDKPLEVSHGLYPPETPPNVVGPDGKLVEIEPLILLGANRRYRNTLQPKQSAVYRHFGLGLGKNPKSSAIWHPFLKDVPPGKYTLTQDVHVTVSGEGLAAEGFRGTSGEVSFEIAMNDPPQQNAQAKDPEANRVVDAQGKPIPGAKLELLPYVIEPKDVLVTFTADDQGRFEYPKETPDSDYFYVQASAPGFVTDRWIGNYSVRLKKDGQPVPDVFKLDRSVTVSGRVLGTEGKPLAGVELVLDYENDRRAVLGAQSLASDAEGRFQFEGLPAGSIYIRYRRWKEGDVVPLPVQLAVVPLKAKDGETISDVTLDLSKATGVVEGRVLDAKKQGIAGAHIRVHAAVAQRLDHSVSTKTGDDGQFRVEGLLPGEYQVRASGGLLGAGLGDPQMVTVKAEKPADMTIVGFTGGRPPPADRKVEPKWGETHEGLQAAIVFSPEKAEYDVGDVVTVQGLVRNVTKEAIEFKDTGSFNELQVTGPDKQVRTFDWRRFTGLPWSEVYRLEPGHELVLKSAFRISLVSKANPQAMFSLPVNPGMDYRFQLRFGTNWNPDSIGRVSGEAILKVK